MFGNYTKAIMAGLFFLTVFGAAIASANGALGLTPQIVAWISLIGGVAGTLLTAMSKNANQPTLAPNSVVVDRLDAKPGANIIAAHKP